MKSTNNKIIGEQELLKYQKHLEESEKSSATIEKYIRDIRKFNHFQQHREVRLENVLAWKQWLLDSGYKITSINSMLAALNNFFEYSNRSNCKVKLLRVQKEIFTQPERELSRDEYLALIETAGREGKERLSLIMQTICSTGIRISELSFITVNAVLTGRTQIQMKGKIRTVFLPDHLRKVLKRYFKKREIKEGAIFITRRNIPMGRTTIWREMKALCKKAGVEPGKVFPHNLRHLFAKTHYSKYQDVVRLSDILGHSSVDTTRIYTLESGNTHIWQLNQLNLIVERESMAT